MQRSSRACARRRRRAWRRACGRRTRPPQPRRCGGGWKRMLPRPSAPACMSSPPAASARSWTARRCYSSRCGAMHAQRVQARVLGGELARQEAACRLASRAFAKRADAVSRSTQARVVEREMHAVAAAEAQRAAERNAAKSLRLRADRARVRWKPCHTRAATEMRDAMRHHLLTSTQCRREACCMCSELDRRALLLALRRNTRRRRRRTRRTRPTRRARRSRRCARCAADGWCCLKQARARPQTGTQALARRGGACLVSAPPPAAMQALRLPTLHVAAAARGAASARPVAARCAPVAAAHCVATRVRVATAPAPRLRRALRVQAASTVDVTPTEVTDVT